LWNNRRVISVQREIDVQYNVINYAQTMNSIEVTAVLDYFRQLAEKRERPSVDVVLRGLVQVFDADEIGVIGMDAASPEFVFPPTRGARAPYPWQTKADLLKCIRLSLCAETHQDEAGNWLVSMVDETQLAWAHRPASRGWNDADKWSWMFASQALLRWQKQSAGVAAPVQRRLEQAAVVTGRLSHDFGNYLTGIMGFTELSLTQVPADGLLHRYLQEVLQAAKDGAEWIRRLHLFCRRNPTRSWPTLLSCILADEETRLRAAGVQGLRWVTDLPHDLPLLDMDAEALQLALTEIVNNTREAAKDQGTIIFTARPLELTDVDCQDLLGSARSGAYVELTLSDDGPGIAADDRAKLFREMFYSTKPRHRGLGLLVVYGILLRYRGALRLSPSPGQGTTLQLYLPVARIEGPTPAHGEAPHLLLVHTNPLLFESMRRIFESHRFQVSVANSPQAALNAYLAPGQSFALIVTDARLPQMSGFDLARRILDHDPDANFLFLHTQSSFHGLAEEELLKRFALLRWPLEPHALLKAVQAALAIQ
jgi:signal transduction histidine kinase/CheY-like chemotaxis protein